MGKGIVYCAKCGTILREKEFARGLAHTMDHGHFCTRCRPLATPTLPVSDSDDHYVPSPTPGRSKSA
jgi:transcription initiation factor TFIIIB Brf1 subunit/transcription initiation factor TFIIB